MIIKPMVRSNMCLNAHPIGCAKEVENQIAYVKSQKAKRGTKSLKEGGNGPKFVLVLGCSTGYGLASRISAAFEYGAERKYLLLFYIYQQLYTIPNLQ